MDRQDDQYGQGEQDEHHVRQSWVEKAEISRMFLHGPANFLVSFPRGLGEFVSRRQKYLTPCRDEFRYVVRCLHGDVHSEHHFALQSWDFLHSLFSRTGFVREEWDPRRRDFYASTDVLRFFP